MPSSYVPLFIYQSCYYGFEAWISLLIQSNIATDWGQASTLKVGGAQVVVGRPAGMDLATVF